MQLLVKRVILNLLDLRKLNKCMHIEIIINIISFSVHYY